MCASTLAPLLQVRPRAPCISSDTTETHHLMPARATLSRIWMCRPVQDLIFSYVTALFVIDWFIICFSTFIPLNMILLVACTKQFNFFLSIFYFFFLCSCCYTSLTQAKLVTEEATSTLTRRRVAEESVRGVETGVTRTTVVVRSW